MDKASPLNKLGLPWIVDGALVRDGENVVAECYGPEAKLAAAFIATASAEQTDVVAAITALTGALTKVRVLLKASPAFQCRDFVALGIEVSTALEQGQRCLRKVKQ